jgi:hypothetical protein
LIRFVPTSQCLRVYTDERNRVAYRAFMTRYQGGRQF